MDRLHDLAGHILKGLHHLAAGDGKGAGQAGHQAAAADLHDLFLGIGVHAADGHLHFLGGALADKHVVLAADIFHHGFVKLVAGDLDGGALHHTAQGDHSDVGGAAADVHDHIAVGLGDVHARPNGRGHRLLDEVHPAGARLLARVDDGAFLHLRDDAGDADDHVGLEQPEAQHLFDKVLDHLFGHFIVGDDTLAQGTHGDDVAGGAAQHALGLRADGQRLAGVLVDGHHGRLAQGDTLALHEHQNGSSSQIYTNIVSGKKHTITPN